MSTVLWTVIVSHHIQYNDATPYVGMEHHMVDDDSDSDCISSPPVTGHMDEFIPKDG